MDKVGCVLCLLHCSLGKDGLQSRLYLDKRDEVNEV